MSFNFPENEEKILEFWQKNKVFEKSVSKKPSKGNFVFFEGPPTANGKPGIHHLLARIYKDIICRYKTMQGFRVERKGGWDTHGLPVEIEVEKKLGITDKKQIEAYGIAKFNKMCKESVWEYKKLWEDFTKRMGFWLDLENPYITYQTDYIESLWWILKKFFKEGMLYEGYRVAPYCPRCGTGLSSHELAQGYKAVRDPSFFVKFKIKSSDPRFANASLLVWTTTPWTLPGNVAVALNKKLSYSKAQNGEGENLIILTDKAHILGQEYKSVEQFKGEELAGLAYEPLYPIKESYKDIYKVYAGDFVSGQEGTGFVHIAPAFGEDDMNLQKDLERKNLAILPIIRSVDYAGKMIAPDKPWNGLFVKKADNLIKDDLQKRGLLFKEELYEHDYPFCWRCSGPLIYYAQNSWFIKTSGANRDMEANNKKIKWVPEHIKDGRFGLWLKEIKDWNLSRNRYWGTPLPIWKCGDKKCGHTEAIESVEDILNKKHTTNNYFVMRHGMSECLKQHINVCYPDLDGCPLAEEGKKQAAREAKKLKGKIDVIYASDLMRTKQTAQIVAQTIGLPEEKIIFIDGLRERNTGDFNHQPVAAAGQWIRNQEHPGKACFPNGESLLDVMKRSYKAIKEIDKKENNKNILIISHENPISVIERALKGESFEKMYAWYQIQWNKKGKGDERIKPAEIRQIKFASLPFDEEMDLNLHRPYIDEVEFLCPKCANKMRRAKEVVDCWFDSGAMPFAQRHYPFENKAMVDKKEQFPADYISEAIDQTRGWFYTLLAISTLLKKGEPYKSVVCLGHVLDEKGEKMSKSKGNIVDPWAIMQKYGADAARWYFYTVNQPGDPKLFSEKDVDQSVKGYLMILYNCLAFLKTYSLKVRASNKQPKPKALLDKWIISRLNSLTAQVESKLEKLDITEGARAIQKFVNDDLSLWYVRRSRKRFQHPKDKKDFAKGTETLAYVLSSIAKISAPFTPFISEEIYFQLGGKQSIHLEKWVKCDKKSINPKLEENMRKTRDIIALALAERAKLGVKVRQPLAEAKISDKNIARDKELSELIQEELNVKKISWGEKIWLDPNITPELKDEGVIREIIRNIMEMRKEADLKPQDKVEVGFSGDKAVLDKINEYGKMLAQGGKISKLNVNNGHSYPAKKDVKLEEGTITIGLKKIN